MINTFKKLVECVDRSTQNAVNNNINTVVSAPGEQIPYCVLIQFYYLQRGLTVLCLVHLHDLRQKMWEIQQKRKRKRWQRKVKNQDSLLQDIAKLFYQQLVCAIVWTLDHLLECLFGSRGSIFLIYEDKRQEINKNQNTLSEKLQL